MQIQTQKRHTAGNTIIEALIAIAVVGVVLTGMSLTMTNSIKNGSEALYREIASRYAQEVVETLKKDKVTRSWDTFSTSPADNASDTKAYCVPANFSSILNGVTNTLVTVVDISTATAVTGCPAKVSPDPSMTFYRTITKRPNSTDATGKSKNYTIRVYWNVDVAGQERSVVVEQTFFKSL